jgi:hypothetical protein
METGPMNHHLAVGTYAYVNKKNCCARLEPEQVSEVLGIASPPASVSHVIQIHRGRPCVFRVFVSSLGPSKAAEALGDIIDQAREADELRPLINCGDYGYLLLTATAGAAAEAREYVRSLRDIARVHVGVGPTSTEIVDYLKRRKKACQTSSSEET